MGAVTPCQGPSLRIDVYCCGAGRGDRAFRSCTQPVALGVSPFWIRKSGGLGKSQQDHGAAIAVDALSAFAVAAIAGIATAVAVGGALLRGRAAHAHRVGVELA